jgi:hypothetical protein
MKTSKIMLWNTQGSLSRSSIQTYKTSPQTLDLGNQNDRIHKNDNDSKNSKTRICYNKFKLDPVSQ